MHTLPPSPPQGQYGPATQGGPRRGGPAGARGAQHVQCGQVRTTRCTPSSHPSLSHSLPLLDHINNNLLRPSASHPYSPHSGSLGDGIIKAYGQRMVEVIAEAIENRFTPLLRTCGMDDMLPQPPSLGGGPPPPEPVPVKPVKGKKLEPVRPVDRSTKSQESRVNSYFFICSYRRS